MLNFFYYTVLAAVHLLIVSLFLILLVLIQKGRGGGLSSAFGGGGGNTAFGSKTGDVLTWATSIVFRHLHAPGGRAQSGRQRPATAIYPRIDGQRPITRQSGVPNQPQRSDRRFRTQATA